MRLLCHFGQRLSQGGADQAGHCLSGAELDSDVRLEKLVAESNYEL
jgi:hypothetical protein